MEYLWEGGRLGHWGYSGDGAWVVGGFLWLLLMAGLVAAAVVLVLRATGGPAAPDRRPVGPAPAAVTDPAVTELRLRYARGDISREDYLRAAADLGVTVPGDGPPPEPTA